MDRFPYTAEDREALIADLTGKKLATRLALIAARDPKTVHDTANDVFDYLSYSKDAEKLVTGEVTFQQVRDKVLENDCEVEAVKEVEAMERRREESARDNRIQQRVWDHFFARTIVGLG